MRPYMPGLAISALSIGLLTALPAAAAPFFSTGDPDGKIATATRPDVGGKFEIESADDFVLATSNSTVITSATFTGLLTGSEPQRRRCGGRDLSGVPEGFGYGPDAQRPDTSELAIRCRVRRSGLGPPAT